MVWVYTIYPLLTNIVEKQLFLYTHNQKDDLLPRGNEPSVYLLPPLFFGLLFLMHNNSMSIMYVEEKFYKSCICTVYSLQFILCNVYMKNAPPA